MIIPIYVPHSLLNQREVGLVINKTRITILITNVLNKLQQKSNCEFNQLHAVCASIFMNA